MVKQECVRFVDNTQEIRDMDINYHISRGTLITVNIADIHMGVINPKTQYDILKEQFIDEIGKLPGIDIIAIAGDFFDHKIMGNSAAAMYGSLLMSDIVNIARKKNSTIILVAGTESHDNGTIRLFYSYVNDPTIDFRLVENIKFEYVKGCKILCIPELYGVDESIYQHYLFKSGWYDMCIMHGTFEGAVYGNNAGESRLFTMKDFMYCTGVIISGHVHVPGCFQKYFYYCGSPIRTRHGEEQDKGFFITCLNLDTMTHYAYFQSIESFIYRTMTLDSIIDEDPKVVIDYISNLKEKEGIDYIKIKFNTVVPDSNRTILSNYYRNIDNVSLEFMSSQEEINRKAETEAQIDEYGFILDSSLTDESIFCKYVNQNEGYEFITVDELKEILNEEL